MIQLLQGDCLELMKQIPDGSVDMILTDIPYGKVNRKSSGLRNLDKGVADIANFNMIELLKNLYRITSGSVYIFCGTEQVSEIRKHLVSSGMSTRLCIWEKSNPSPMNGKRIWLSSIECCVFGRKPKSTFNENCKSSVWKYPTARGKLHPTMKPVKLMERLIQASSNSGDTVLDCFMGSGSTGIACLNTGRRFIGIELDPHYFEVAKNRIEAAA